VIHNELWHKEALSPMEEIETLTERILKDKGTAGDASRLQVLRNRLKDQLPRRLKSRSMGALVFQRGSDEARMWADEKEAAPFKEKITGPYQLQAFENIQRLARLMLEEKLYLDRMARLVDFAQARQDYARMYRDPYPSVPQV